MAVPQGVPPLPPRYEWLLQPVTMRTERERLVFLKIRQAKQHIDQFNTLWQEFVRGNPFEVFREEDEKTGGFVDRLRIREMAPLERYSLIAGDVAHNLRSALDHLMWHLVESDGGIPTKSTCFPVFKNRAAYDAGAQGAVQGVSIQTRRAIDLLKPYGGGFETLWALHQLDIQDKHKLLLVSLMQVQSVGLDMGRSLAASIPEGMRDHFAADEIPSMVIYLRPEDRTAHDGAELFRAGDASGVHMEPRYVIAPELAPGQPGEGSSLGDLMYEFCYVTQRIVMILGRYLRD